MKKKTSNFTALTTFDLKKHPFAIDMVNSFDVNWPENIKLIVYLENSHLILDQNINERLIIKDFHEEIPEYNIFCKKFKHKEKYTDDFRLNAFRFAYKVYAIYKAMKSNKSDYFIWLDSDIKTHTKIPLSFLENLTNENCYLSYLGRNHVKNKYLRYSECGFLIFNTVHNLHKLFWKEMMKMYDDGMLFDLPEWHDSYIFDVVRKKLEKEKGLKNFNITDLKLVEMPNEPDDHVFVLSLLGNYMDHKKGDRKDVKWSPELIKRIKFEKDK